MGICENQVPTLYIIYIAYICAISFMNLPSKEDAEDNLMRVCSKEIAAELLEMTFDSEMKMWEW